MAHGKMSGQIFISYRREESRWLAGRLYDRLAARFDRKQIFRDIDGIALGDDFVKTVEERVGESDVLIAVIGAHWLTSTDAQGGRRLENPEDFVRMEIATALRRNIRVIPVLVDGALMPRSADLPDDLKLLVRRQALQIADTHFDDDCRKLADAIEQVLHPPPSLPPGPVPPIAPEPPSPPVIATLAMLPVDWIDQVERYIDAKDYAKALPLLQKGADAGDTYGMFNLGVLYENGQGVAQDYGTARKWYQKAAEAGDPYGMFYLGLLYDQGLGVAEDHTKAREWSKRPPMPATRLP
jgi:hypothetical protein